MHVYIYTHIQCTEVREHLSGVDSLLVYGPLGIYSEEQADQASLFTESSLQPCSCLFETGVLMAQACLELSMSRRMIFELLVLNFSFSSAITVGIGHDAQFRKYLFTRNKEKKIPTLESS